MKKILSLVVCMLICLSVQADEHLKFMGIPLDGTITQFQAKLAQKGVNHDIAESKTLPPGCRAFRGIFSGQKAKIGVYYDIASKLVYRAKAILLTDSKDICENKYNEFTRMLSNKYYDAKVEIVSKDNHEAKIFFIKNDETSIYRYIGTIDVYRTVTDSYPENYFLHIDYTDTLNSLKRENRNMEDL